jgi:hypothetical protein
VDNVTRCDCKCSYAKNYGGDFTHCSLKVEAADRATLSEVLESVAGYYSEAISTWYTLVIGEVTSDALGNYRGYGTGIAEYIDQILGNPAVCFFERHPSIDTSIVATTLGCEVSIL